MTTSAKPLTSAAVSRPVQPPKASSPMSVTDEGIVIAVRPVQLWKAHVPMDVTEEGMVITVRPVQP